MLHTKLSRTVFESPFVYDEVFRTILFGYGKNEARLERKVQERYGQDTPPDYNCIVIGVSAESASLRVNDVFKGNFPDNVIAIGADSDEQAMLDQLFRRPFNGHVLLTPDLEFARDYVFERIAAILKTLSYDIDNRRGRHRDFHVMIPNSVVADNVLGALFEDWKTRLSQTNQVFVDGENPKFSRSYHHDPKERIKKGLGYDAEHDTVPGEMRIAEPDILCPLKTFNCYMTANQRFDTGNLHAVRLERDFLSLPAGVLREIIRDLSPCELDSDTRGRIVCVDDEVLWKIFEDSICVKSYYPDQPDYACACDSTSDGKKKIQIVTMQQLRK